LCVREQEKYFRALGLEPVTLFGRKLTLIDAQNIFCETDKLARVRHDEEEFWLDRTKIHQRYSPPDAKPLPAPFFPPEWGLSVSLPREPRTPEKKPVRSRLFDKIRRTGMAYWKPSSLEGIGTIQSLICPPPEPASTLAPFGPGSSKTNSLSTA
jgi:hypothetical protein